MPKQAVTTSKGEILIFILPYLTFGPHQHNAWEQAQNNIYEQEKKNLVAYEGIATSS